MKQIASRDNPLFRQLRQLLTSAAQRRRSGLMVLEGIHLAEAWLQAGGEVTQCAIAESALADPEVAALLQRLPEARTAVLGDALYRSLSLLDQGASLLLLAAQPDEGLTGRIGQDCVILDRVQDAGNTGTILRTAAAAGVGLAVCVGGGASPWSPKALRAGMGAQFRMRIATAATPAEVMACLDVPLIVATLQAPHSLYATDLRSPLAWVLGNEGQGPDAAWLDAARQISIPQSDAVESLNVAAAAAVCLFEMRRQRGG